MLQFISYIVKFALTLIGIMWCTYTIQAQENQDAWTLQQCVDHATQNNLQVMQQEIVEQISNNMLTQSKLDVLPSLNGSASYNVNFGRSVDPTSNDFVTQSIQSTSFSLTSNLVLFSGLRKVNTVKQNKYDLLSNQYNTQNTINDISLNIAGAYLQILLNKEDLVTREEQLKLSKEQLEQTIKLAASGSVPQGSVDDSKAQLANDSLSLILSQNALELSRLNLAIILRLDDIGNFDVAAPNVETLDVVPMEATTPEEVFQKALSNQPGIKSSMYNMKSAEATLRLAKGLHAPTLSFFVNVRTNHSSLSRQVIDNELITTPVGFVDDGSFTPVLSIISIPQFGTVPVFDQYSQNFNQSVGLSMSVPIFNGWRTQTSVRNAKLQLLSSQYTDQGIKDQLKSDVYRAYTDEKASYQTYLATKNSLEALTISYDYAEKRYNAGAITALEKSTAWTNLTNAKVTLIRAKYDYIFKLKILDFYLGRPITLE